MKGSGPKHERETIINFNDEDDTASIWTASETVYRRLMKRLGSEYLTEDGERHAEFKIPVKFIDLPRVKVKRVMSDSHKARLMAGRSLAERQKRVSRGIPEGGTDD